MATSSGSNKLPINYSVAACFSVALWNCMSKGAVAPTLRGHFHIFNARLVDFASWNSFHHKLVKKIGNLSEMRRSLIFKGGITGIDTFANSALYRLFNF